MFLFTVPHSGETIPREATWLESIDKPTLLTDVDRFVDELYQPVCDELKIPMIKMSTHRYVLDLNRLPQDIDSSCVSNIPSTYNFGAHHGKYKSRSFVSGFHWRKTTHGASLMHAPISFELHQKIVELYYKPFHAQFKWQEDLLLSHSKTRFHLDLHSMPSIGGSSHKDSGQIRDDVVISDCEGLSCDSFFKDIVIESFKNEGLSVSYNWPYLGGRLTEMYGRPLEHKHSIQIELNRRLYMDEQTKDKTSDFIALQSTLSRIIKEILDKTLKYA